MDANSKENNAVSVKLQRVLAKDGIAWIFVVLDGSFQAIISLLVLFS